RRRCATTGTAGGWPGWAPSRTGPSAGRRCHRRCCGAAGRGAGARVRSQTLMRVYMPVDLPSLPATPQCVHTDWLLGRRAGAVDTARREVRLDDGTVLPFDGLVVATGVRGAGRPGPDGMA